MHELHVIHTYSNFNVYNSVEWNELLKCIDILIILIFFFFFIKKYVTRNKLNNYIAINCYIVSSILKSLLDIACIFSNVYSSDIAVPSRWT